MGGYKFIKHVLLTSIIMVHISKTDGGEYGLLCYNCFVKDSEFEGNILLFKVGETEITCPKCKTKHTREVNL